MFQNALTKQGYSPRNTALLAVSQPEPDDYEVAGFRQWLELGRCVAKGQHGTSIVMIVPKKIERSDGSVEKKPVMKSRRVFFRSQTIELGSHPVRRI